MKSRFLALKTASASCHKVDAKRQVLCIAKASKFRITSKAANFQVLLFNRRDSKLCPVEFVNQADTVMNFHKPGALLMMRLAVI